MEGRKISFNDFKLHDLYPITGPQGNDADGSTDKPTQKSNIGHDVKKVPQFVPLTVKESERILHYIKCNQDQQTKPTRTWIMERSIVLNKVKAFLPAMKESNAKLLPGDPKLDIENVNEGESYVEMNVAVCGQDTTIATQFIQDTSGSSSESEDESLEVK